MWGKLLYFLWISFGTVTGHTQFLEPSRITSRSILVVILLYNIKTVIHYLTEQTHVQALHLFFPFQEA